MSPKRVTDMEHDDFGHDNLGTDADSFYEALMMAHEELSLSESHAFNARLILLMANQIGDKKTLTTLLDMASRYEKEPSS